MRSHLKTVKQIITFAMVIILSLSLNVYADRPSRDAWEDKVNVHTPIIAPAILYHYDRYDEDGDSKKWEKTTTRVKSPTGSGYDPNEFAENQLCNPCVNGVDGVYPEEMRLDEWYMIHWQDITEKNWQGDDIPVGDEHRDTDTPPDYESGDEKKAGGYEGQTKLEDEFVKQKYMKFPFEVYYHGKFYDKNQWIQILSPNKYNAIGNPANNSKGWQRDSSPSEEADTGIIKSSNHWKDTPVYIPSWSTEGLYSNIKSKRPSYEDDKRTPAMYDTNTCVQFRVDSISIEGRKKAEETANKSYNMHVWVPESREYDDSPDSAYNGNESMAAYTCIYNIPVELSGWVYGFTITGTSDSDLFNVQTQKSINSTQIQVNNDYSFTANKQDKKSGLKNRLGEKVLRFAADGEIGKVVDTSGAKTTQWVEQNTIALHSSYTNGGQYHWGKSNAFPSQGTVSKGTTFAFLFKTMSNLWDFDGDGGDHVEITPTFQWKHYDRTSNSWKTVNHENLKIYYNPTSVSENNKNNKYIAYGSKADRDRIYKANLSNEQFRQSYYEKQSSNPLNVSDQSVYADGGKQYFSRYGDWVSYTAGKTGVSQEQFLNRKNDCYTLSEIKLDDELRLLSGEYDQMKFNIFNQGHDITDPDFMTYHKLAKQDGNSDGWKGQYTTNLDGSNHYDNPSQDNANLDEKVRQSIQTWYGSYFIPGSLLIVDTTKSGSSPIGEPYSKFKGNWANPKTGASLGLTGEYASKEFTDYIQYYALKRAKNGGLNDTDPIFIKDGYLIINFDITVYKNGTPYMKYNGGNLGGWTIEDYRPVPPVTPPGPGTPVPPPYDPNDPPSPDDPPHNPSPNPPSDPFEPVPPTDPGDIIVIDLTKSTGEKYRAGIFNIN